MESGAKTVKANRSSEEHGGRGVSVGNVRALAGREVKRTWRSYLTSALVIFLFGILAVFSAFTVWEIEPSGQGGAEASEILFADLFFLFALANLAVNFTSPRYMNTRNDAFSEYLEFLRTLPVYPGEAVAARALVMLVASAVMTCVFFAPPYALAGGSLWSTLSPGHYLSFAAVWTAYGLISSGGLLYLELGVRGAAFRFRCMMVWTILLLAAVLLCNLVLDVRLVAGSLALTDEYGALAAVGALAAGISGFALFALATARRAARRL